MPKILDNLYEIAYGYDSISIWGGQTMIKEKLVEKIKELLKADSDLNFLLELRREDLEKLLACIRDRVDKVGR